MQRKHFSIVALLFAQLFIFGVAYPEKHAYPPEVAEALTEAGDNSAELGKVLSHCASGGDSLKLQAAYYLIANMEDHSYITYELRDTVGTQVDFNALDYTDYDRMKAAFDTLESRHGKLDFEKKETIDDLHSIKADFLINQIDFAFRAWREKPWAKYLSFDYFCQYILPYRGSNEPLEDWRKIFWDKYKDIESKMINPSDPIEAASVINDDIKSWFSFDPRYYYHPTDQGLSEMLTSRLGRCEDMTNLTIYAMRANGLAVTSDYTPYWANSGNNHAWNAIVTPDGKVIPFMGAESNPGKYHLANKVAKVYRKTFGKQTTNLAFQQRKQETMPKYLSGKSYIDVTEDYTKVCEVKITFEREIPDSIDIAYLCVFNSGEWNAIDWGKIESGKVVFTNIGVDIAYLPGLYMGEEIVPIGVPFILRSDCGILELRSEKQETISAELTSTTHRKQEISTDGIAKVFLTVGQTYELFYWKDDWQSVGKAVASDTPLVFEDIPAGSLYWLVAENSDHEERIFTIEDGRQVWW